MTTVFSWKSVTNGNESNYLFSSSGRGMRVTSTGRAVFQYAGGPVDSDQKELLFAVHCETPYGNWEVSDGVAGDDLFTFIGGIKEAADCASLIEQGKQLSPVTWLEKCPFPNFSYGYVPVSIGGFQDPVVDYLLLAHTQTGKLFLFLYPSIYDQPGIEPYCSIAVSAADLEKLHRDLRAGLHKHYTSAMVGSGPDRCEYNSQSLLHFTPGEARQQTVASCTSQLRMTHADLQSLSLFLWEISQWSGNVIQRQSWTSADEECAINAVYSVSVAEDDIHYDRTWDLRVQIRSLPAPHVLGVIQTNASLLQRSSQLSSKDGITLYGWGASQYFSTLIPILPEESHIESL